jgi:hypothetical protein
VVEMAIDALELRDDVGADRGGDLETLAGEIQIHQALLVVTLKVRRRMRRTRARPALAHLDARDGPVHVREDERKSGKSGGQRENA